MRIKSAGNLVPCSLMTTGSVVTILLLFINLPAAGQNRQTENNTYFQSETIFTPQTKHVHSSSIVQLPNEDLLCCWYEGSGERDANDVVIMGSRMRKGDKEWSKAFLMADTPGFPDCNPMMFIDPTGRLHLLWITIIANRWEYSLLRTRLSTDYLNEGAPKWSWQDIILLKPGNEFAETIVKRFSEMKTPEMVSAEYAPRYEELIVMAARDAGKREIGWMTRTQPLLLPDGKLLLPLYSDGFSLSLVAISIDNGDTWKPGTPIVGRGNIQPALVRKKDGTLIAFMRDNGDFPGRIMLSESADNGSVWSIARKSDIPNPGSSVYVLSLNSGNWVMACNDLEDGRYRLAVRMSDDEGQSWKWTRYLEKKEKGSGSFSYPTVIQDKKGLIHVSYSWNVKDQETIMHAVFNEAWVKEK